ncbi:TlpA disulfide reductase family protein [Prevotella sp. kh1p2]|uniref:TlpA disulfide reductase family protein n=1 Tax=Prevotella sp. kh1p2 TaxID=1761883 RepID=UPI0008C8CE45|nr:TlpA disulfide reductase family protein [Prevotella sp. kh1p2]SES84115.1 Peroxiredoxin [Prevotella sp. kh1p2]SNU10772.1 Peroxiredoxin [Prevotellaceae bacterium KH2P17]
MRISKLFAAAIIALASLAITSCNNKKFQVSGTISDAKDSTLYFENMSLNGPQVVDSVKLGENGEFSFSEATPDAPEFYRLRIAGQIINVSIDSTEAVNVKASYPNMSSQYEVSGSENCSKIKELALMQIDLQNRINAVVNNPNMGADSVQTAVEALLASYKDNVKRNYIFKEPMKAYAYFALFQTFALGGAQNLIFNPRSSEDDVKVFAAVATSWDTFYPKAERGKNLHNIAIEGMKDVRIIKNAQAKQVIEASKVNETGIINISLADNKGRTRNLTDLKGRVVLLDFHVFASEGSTKRIMTLRSLYDKYHALGLEIYQVSLDPDEHFWKTQTAALPWISVRDADGSTAATYNVQGVPTFFLIDKQNTLYKRDAQIKDLDAEIRALCGK